MCEDVSIDTVATRSHSPLTVFNARFSREGCTTHLEVLLRCLCRPRMPFSRRGPPARSRRCPRCQASHSQCMPLFLSESGALCTKAAMVATVDASAARPANPNRRPLATDNMADTAGASLASKPWTAAGVLQHVVAAMGREAGITVRRYTAEAPLASSCHLAPVSAVHDLLAIFSPISRWKQQRLRRTKHCPRPELANLGADLTSEATNLHAIRPCITREQRHVD